MKTKIQIKTMFGKILFEYEAIDNSIKKTLTEAVSSGANLRDADLRDAYLGGADLGGTKNYYNSDDFAQEIIRRQPTKTFTEKEWAIIGQILVHRLCWETIKKRWNKKALPIFKKLKNSSHL